MRNLKQRILYRIHIEILVEVIMCPTKSLRTVAIFKCIQYCEMIIEKIEQEFLKKKSVVLMNMSTSKVVSTEITRNRIFY